MKVTVTYTEKEKQIQKVIRDTITGGIVILAKYAALVGLFCGVPAWMILDYFMHGY